MAKKALLLIGTKKGLFLFTRPDRRRWRIMGPFQNGKEVNHAVHDPGTGKIYATANEAWLGCEIVSTENLGKKRTSARTGPAFAKNSGLKLGRIWHLDPGSSEDWDAWHLIAENLPPIYSVSTSIVWS